MTSTTRLTGQTVLVIGGTQGIGLATARLARSEGANVILVARDPERLQRVGLELGASIAAFDVTDLERLGRFFEELPGQVDHVLVTGPGPYYAQLAELDLDLARDSYGAHLLVPVQVARKSVGKVRPGGTLLFISGTGGRRASSGALITATLPHYRRSHATSRSSLLPSE
jgi:NAD(P)-dependent dehydrogenase (short-subunit alcohol dehydrogenase family)